MMKPFKIVSLLILSFITLSCQSPSTQSSDKTWLLEKIPGNEFDIARSYLDEFDTLTLNQKLTLYYLTRAAIAGRDIYYDQRHKDAVRIRIFFEQLFAQKSLSQKLHNQIHDYLKLIWINNAQYHARTGLKFVPAFSFEDLKAALPADTDLEWLKKPVFDAKHQPILTNLTPTAEEGDIIQASANNIYDVGISLDELNALDPSWLTKLNVRFHKTNNQIQPMSYKIGGAYGKQLEHIVHFLNLALKHADEEQKSGLQKLIKFYQTGEEEDFRQASIDWLKSQPKVDTINGFIESYMDPRQTVGSWEGMAYHVSEDMVLKAISSHVQYFEDHMPWKEEFKRKNITSKPVATLINVAVATGEAGPVTWGGINLPNYQDIRSQFGSKNVVLTNLIEARNQIKKDLLISEFYLPEYQEIMGKHYQTAYQMLLFMHEVIGHGSGKASDSLVGDPRNHIGQNYGAWEEARASLVAWHHIGDPFLATLGAFDSKDHEDVMKAFYLKELQDQLLTLRAAAHEDILREAHDRADQMIFEYVRLNSGNAFEVLETNGSVFVKINDVHAIHKTASELLTIVHEAKATGNKALVDEFLTRYGNQFNKSWRDIIIQHANRLGLAKEVAMVFPKLVPVFENGMITNITINNAESFTDQQLRFGRASQTTDISDITH